MAEYQDPSFSDVTASQLNDLVSEMLAESQINHDLLGQDLSSTGLHPCDNKWPGPYEFSLWVPDDATSKTSWVYSSQLTKVFIPANCTLPIHFKCVWPEITLHVRALPVYLDVDDIPEPVVRCTHHLQDKKNDFDRYFPFPAHVLRCEEIDSCYIEDPNSRRLSVVTPLSSLPPGADHVVFHYKMMCKTSCLGGMNRRPIQIIFTLEYPTGEVVGRDTLKVRCCSCPKRDMKKEEEAVNKKQRDLDGLKTQCMDHPSKMANTVVPPPSKKKKIKLEVGSYDHLIPLVGGKDYLIKCAKILRGSTIGDKLASGQTLNDADKANLATFNQIIGEVTKEETDEEVMSR